MWYNKLKSTMFNNKLLTTLLFVIIVIFIAQPCLADSQELTIVFSGDMRGELENCRCPKDDFGGLPRRGKYISEVRAEVQEMLLLDIGDVLPLFKADSNKDEILRNSSKSFKAMNIMGYDVMNVGETDLILGEEFLGQEENNLSFPLISANIVDKYTGEVFFEPYVIKVMQSGLKIGILGLVNERYVINSDRLKILPNKEVMSKYLAELRAKSDIVIVLGHLGLPYSIELANAVEGIDIILSGHWDTESQEPIKIGDTLVMPTTYHSRKIGRLDISIHGGNIYSYKWESTPLDETYDGNRVLEDLISEKPETEGINETSLLQMEKIASERSLRVIVFYSSGCRACMEIDRDLLPRVEEKYGEEIIVERYDIGLTQNYEQMVRLEKLCGVEKGGYVPEVIVSRYVLMGKEEITSQLDEVIEKALGEQGDVKKNEDIALQAVEYHPPVGPLILSRFQSLSVYAVLTAGLLDGVNPCAFTTIVFFISFLSFVGYRRREMFFAGLAFTLAVFITYLLIGLGVFRFLRALKTFGYVTYFINILISALAFLLGVLSLVDYFKFKKTKDAKSIILKLPQFIRNKIHSIIGSDFRTTNKSEKRTFLKIIWIALSAGFMVSVLESFCTGQVYLPTIAFVMRIPEKRIPALLYLLFYNLAFVVPLITVFLLGLFGATSSNFSKFMEKHLGAVKLSTAALFFALATLLIIFR